MAVLSGEDIEVRVGDFRVYIIDRADSFVDAKISCRALLYTCLR